MHPTLWIDITELFGQFAFKNHPTGISRVVISLGDALTAEPGNLFGRVRPFFWHPLLQAPFAIEEPGLGHLATFFSTLKARYAAANRAIPPIRSGIKKGLVTSIPRPLRFRLFPHLNGVTHFLDWARHEGIRGNPVEFASRDCVFVPGSFWLDRYSPRLGELARAKRTSVVAFVHDLLLLSDVGSLPGHHGQQFRRGLENFLPYCTAIACNSAYTRNELRKQLPRLQTVPIKVCRLGDVAQQMPDGSVPVSLSNISGKRYALLVSTLIPRKNHRLAVTAWQKLWAMLGEKTPWLVLVGSGVPDAALAELFARPATYGNRIIRLVDVDDDTLESLYADAWITIYPSLGEGYGLPVAESLARGKVCLATLSGGTGEVDPNLIDPIGAADPGDLVDRVVNYLVDPDLLSAREQRIRSQYRSTRWQETAQAVRCVLEDAILSGS